MVNLRSRLLRMATTPLLPMLANGRASSRGVEGALGSVAGHFVFLRPAWQSVLCARLARFAAVACRRLSDRGCLSDAPPLPQGPAYSRKGAAARALPKTCRDQQIELGGPRLLLL